MDKIISQSKYSRKQHKDFYTFHLLRRSGTIKFLGVIIILMLFVALTSTFGDGLPIKEENMNSVIFSWIMFGFALSIIPILVITRINNVVKQETPERIQSTEKIEITKVKFTRSNDQIEGKSVFGWRDIQTICETDKYFYVYLSEENGVFIVKDEIIEGDVETFRKLAEANLKRDKKGKLPYKRYGEVRKQYNATKRAEKKQKKLEKKNQGK
jgi:hypothetical protein